MPTDKLSEAVKLIKAGNKQSALPLLKEIVQLEPGNETAWLWLYSCVESTAQKKYCLQKAIEINPDNLKAQEALRKLSVQEIRPAMQSKPLQANFQANAPMQARSSLRVVNSKPANSKRKNNKNRALTMALALGGLAFVAAIVVIGGVWFYSQFVDPSVAENFPDISQIFTNNGTSYASTDENTYDPGIEENTENGNGINPFKDTENLYENVYGVFILNYGELIEVTRSQKFPSPDSPVLKFNDIVFIIDGVLDGPQVVLTKYMDGQFAEDIPVEVKQQGNGSSKRIELRNMKDGVYCFSAFSPQKDIEEQPFYCFQVGNTVTIAASRGLVSADQVKLTPISFQKEPDAESPEWSTVVILYAVENQSNQTVIYRMRPIKVKTQQGLEYDCQNSTPIFSASFLPARFRVFEIASCKIPTESSGYTLFGNGTIVTQRNTNDSFNTDDNNAEWVWEFNAEQKNTNITFPTLDNVTNYSQERTMVYQLGQAIDLTDVKVNFNLSEEGDEEYTTIIANMENTFIGGDITLEMNGAWFFSDGLSSSCSMQFNIELGNAKAEPYCSYMRKQIIPQEVQDILGYYPPSNRFSGSCLFINQIIIHYSQGNKEAVTFPNNILICLP